MGRGEKTCTYFKVQLTIYQSGSMSNFMCQSKDSKTALTIMLTLDLE